MSTVRDLCTRALVNLGLEGLVTDGTPNEEITDALRHFNHQIDFLESRRLWDPVFTKQTVQTDSAKIYIGPTAPTDGNPIITIGKVPNRIRAVQVEVDNGQGNYRPLKELTETEYLDYNLNQAKAFPKWYIWRPISGSYGELILHSVPDSVRNINVFYNQQAAGTYVLDDVLNLKPGYEAFLEYDLTCRLAKPLNIEVNQWLDLKNQYWRSIKANRTQSTYQDQGDAQSGWYDINSDTVR